MRRCGDRLVFANCCGQSLKSVSPGTPFICTQHCHTLPQYCHTLNCHTYHTPPKIKLRPRTTHESMLQLQPFIVATITQWVFNDSLTNEMKSHFVLLIHICLRFFCFQIYALDWITLWHLWPLGVAGWPVQIDKPKTFEFLPLMICILSKAGRIYLFSWQ